VSSPIDRSFDPNEVSFYAPKWAQNGKTRSDARVAGDSDIANNGPADIPDFESDNYQRRRSLEPTLVPEPPAPEPWPRRRAQTLTRTGNGIGTFTGILLAVFIAALIALGIVGALPTVQGITTAPNAVAELASKGRDIEPKPAAVPLATAPKPTPAPARPWPAAQQNAALNPPANVPGVFNSQTGPAQLVIDGLPRTSLSPASSTHENSVSAYANQVPAAPPAAEARLQPSAAPVSTAKGEAVPARKEPVRSLGRDEIETLLKQGEDFVSVGDFSSARIVFGRVAEAGDARGALALAATYDPVALAKIGAKGATPDEAKAREWYQKAKDLGSAKAAPRLEALKNRAQ
jgi:hypothetical protein